MNIGNNSGFCEKEILTDALSTEKSTSGIYNTFANECVCAQLKNDLLKNLNETHKMQFEVFSEMQQRGLYSPAQAQQQKIDQAKQKFSQQANQQTY